LLTFLRAAAIFARAALFFGADAVFFSAAAVFFPAGAILAGRKPPAAFLILPRVSCQPFQLRSKTMPFGSLNLRSKSSSSGSPRSKKNLASKLADAGATRQCLSVQRHLLRDAINLRGSPLEETGNAHHHA
jgi:hypothetical protein